MHMNWFFSFRFRSIFETERGECNTSGVLLWFCLTIRIRSFFNPPLIDITNNRVRLVVGVLLMGYDGRAFCSHHTFHITGFPMVIVLIFCFFPIILIFICCHISTQWFSCFHISVLYFLYLVLFLLFFLTFLISPQQLPYFNNDFLSNVCFTSSWLFVFSDLRWIGLFLGVYTEVFRITSAFLHVQLTSINSHFKQPVCIYDNNRRNFYGWCTSFLLRMCQLWQEKAIWCISFTQFVRTFYIFPIYSQICEKALYFSYIFT